MRVSRQSPCARKALCTTGRAGPLACAAAAVYPAIHKPRPAAAQLQKSFSLTINIKCFPQLTEIATYDKQEEYKKRVKDTQKNKNSRKRNSFNELRNKLKEIRINLDENGEKTRLYNIENNINKLLDELR